MCTMLLDTLDTFFGIYVGSLINRWALYWINTLDFLLHRWKEFFNLREQVLITAQ